MYTSFFFALCIWFFKFFLPENLLKINVQKWCTYGGKKSGTWCLFHGLNMMFYLNSSEKFWKSKMTKSCINGEKRVTYIGSKIMYIGHWSLFMTPPKNRKYLCHPVLSHPRNFYATPQFWNVYATHFYTTLNISVFQRKIRNWGSISTFLTHFFHSPPFFYGTL